MKKIEFLGKEFPYLLPIPKRFNQLVETLRRQEIEKRKERIYKAFLSSKEVPNEKDM